MRVRVPVPASVCASQEFEQCKARLIERGEWFAKMSLTSRKQIAFLVDRFISDGKVSRRASSQRARFVAATSARLPSCQRACSFAAAARGCVEWLPVLRMRPWFCRFLRASGLPIASSSCSGRELSLSLGLPYLLSPPPSLRLSGCDEEVCKRNRISSRVCYVVVRARARERR